MDTSDGIENLSIDGDGSGMGTDMGIGMGVYHLLLNWFGVFLFVRSFLLLFPSLLFFKF